MPKELRRRLQAADPNLTIVPGHAHKRRPKSKDEWESGAGLICTVCGREYFRGRDGMCYRCWENEKDKEVEVQDKTGITNWLGMDILQQITHQARKDQ